MRWQFLTRLINAQLSHQESVCYIPLNVLGWVIINICDLCNGLTVEILFFTWLVLYPLCLKLVNNSELSSPVVFFPLLRFFMAKIPGRFFNPKAHRLNQVHRPQGPAGPAWSSTTCDGTLLLTTDDHAAEAVTSIISGHLFGVLSRVFPGVLKGCNWGNP